MWLPLSVVIGSYIIRRPLVKIQKHLDNLEKFVGLKK